MFPAVRISMRQFSRTERRKFIALLVARALTGVLDILGVLLIGVIAAIAAGTLSTGAASKITILGFPLSSLGPQYLLPLAGVTLAFFIVKAALAAALTKRTTTFIAAFEHRTSTALVSRILGGSLSEVERWSKSELSYGLNYSMNAAYGRLLSHFATVTTEGFLLVLIAAVLFVVSPVTMLVVVGYFAVIGAIIQVFIGRRQQRAGAVIAESTVLATDALDETVGAFREIFTMGRQNFFVARFGRARAAMAYGNADNQYLMSLPRYVVEAALMLGAVALIASQLLTNNLASAASTLGIFLTAGFRIMASLLPLQNAAGSIGLVSSEAEVAHRLLASYPARPAESSTLVVAEPAPTGHEPGGLTVELKDVFFRYDGASEDALSAVDLTIPAGTYTAVIGASGAGKSTLADLLLGLIQPARGTITLGGATPRELDTSAPGSIAYVPQKPGLVSGSIAENVALGRDLDEIDLERVDWALAQANLDAFVAGLDSGVLTSVGKQNNALSGGQIQRLGLARALYADPRLLVLDEATSALDAESESIVGESLKKLYGKVTLVVIAHRLSTVQHADVVHLVDGGRIVASGPFAQLVKTVPQVAHYAELMSLDEERS
ncbi:ABC transporter ATP-binding protein [Lysinimonas soli]|uniref:ABC transporter ATP-binding protein n=1 Tax=Lysinimonas soli TaxID=1074233 RepID=A0ABW0NS85_9MICO